MDWIQGDKFKGLATFTFSPKEKQRGDYDNLENTFSISRLQPLNLIYTHTIYVQQLFQLISRLNNKFVVITHNADVNVDSGFVLPKNVVHWFTQNVDVDNPRIESIPIGLENDRWFKNINKKGKMIKMLHTDRKFYNWVYMNHNINTNPEKRLAPYWYLEGKDYVTTDKGQNGQNFDHYLENLYNHKFMVCPEGNGIDTHRTWEALYMGVIPIEKRNLNNRFYKELPICFVNEWSDINEEFLEKEYVRIKTRDWKMEMLTFEFWKNKILSHV
jgi:hypothetical protein